MYKSKMNIFEAVENTDPNGQAIEALIQAEMQFMEGNIGESEDEGFTQMAYKDDDGYWVVTGKSQKYNSYDELLEEYPFLG